jgi:hypothetical protein
MAKPLLLLLLPLSLLALPLDLPVPGLDLVPDRHAVCAEYPGYKLNAAVNLFLSAEIEGWPAGKAVPVVSTSDDGLGGRVSLKPLLRSPPCSPFIFAHYSPRE